METVQHDLSEFLKCATRFRGLADLAPEVMVDFLRNEVLPLMQRVVEIGEPAGREFKALENLRNELMAMPVRRSA